MKVWKIGLGVLCAVWMALPEGGLAEQVESYTPMGAIAGGNATGEITPWKGAQGLVCPEGFEKGSWPPNPYKGEEPLFRIDHTNVEQYQERLSPGQIARLKRNKHYYMTVYPTHRNMEFHEALYRATERSRQTVYLDENNVLQGYQGGVPFPLPRNGIEAIWNVKRPYMGDDSLTHECRRIVSPSGRVMKSLRRSLVITYDERRLFSRLPNPDGISQKIKAMHTYPAAEAGITFLTVEYIDDNRLEDTWLYLPTLRRVRRAPTLAGGGDIGGESTMDELALEFRGPVNDWDWKLLGRREMYIPVNNYEIWKPDGTDAEECLAGDMNPAGARYELRRVWAVEGTAREGLNHPYSRRVGYFDEDTWMPAAGDRYDRRGNLWRMIEYYTLYCYCQQQRMLPAYIYLNLETGRYELSGGCRRQGTLLGVYDPGLDESEFTVQSMRTFGR